MKVLVACEFSGIVRDAFIAKGHDAWSCDLLPTEKEGPHLIGDLMDFLAFDWFWIKYDMMICFPPCTYLCSSGARWWENKEKQQSDALHFVKFLLDAPINKICLENPIGIINTKIRKPDQIIQPWMFGHGETKATCLWLKNLPKLKATNIVEGRKPRVHYESPGKDRWKNRSRTYQGIADAMAEQWG